MSHPAIADGPWQYQVLIGPGATPRLPPVGPDPVQELIGLADTVRDEPIVAARHSVYAHFGALFGHAGIESLSREGFEAFADYRNNLRWRGIGRNSSRVSGDMPHLRRTLRTVLDESRPLADRLHWLWPVRGQLPLPGMGPALLTPILHIGQPERYGVWNSASESGLRILGLWPQQLAAPGRAERYLAVNRLLGHLAHETGIDLWTLDVLLSRVRKSWWLSRTHSGPW